MNTESARILAHQRKRFRWLFKIGAARPYYPLPLAWRFPLNYYDKTEQPNFVELKGSQLPVPNQIWTAESKLSSHGKIAKLFATVKQANRIAEMACHSINQSSITKVTQPPGNSSSSTFPNSRDSVPSSKRISNEDCLKVKSCSIVIWSPCTSNFSIRNTINHVLLTIPVNWTNFKSITRTSMMTPLKFIH